MNICDMCSKPIRHDIQREDGMRLPLWTTDAGLTGLDANAKVIEAALFTSGIKRCDEPRISKGASHVGEDW